MRWELVTKSRGGKIFLSFLLLSLLLSFFFVYPVSVLRLSDSQGNTLAIFPPEDFSVIYTHSVERTDVKESYHIQGDYILLTDTWFSSYGAGLPATTQYDFEISPQGFHIYNINKSFEEVVYRTGQKIAQHRLVIGDREIYFSEFSDPGQAVGFSLGKSAPWKLYIGGGY